VLTGVGDKIKKIVEKSYKIFKAMPLLTMG